MSGRTFPTGEGRGVLGSSHYGCRCLVLHPAHHLSYRVQAHAVKNTGNRVLTEQRELALFITPVQPELSEILRRRLGRIYYSTSESPRHLTPDGTLHPDNVCQCYPLQHNPAVTFVCLLSELTSLLDLFFLSFFYISMKLKRTHKWSNH